MGIDEKKNSSGRTMMQTLQLQRLVKMHFLVRNYFQSEEFRLVTLFTVKFYAWLQVSVS